MLHFNLVHSFIFEITIVKASSLNFLSHCSLQWWDKTLSKGWQDCETNSSWTNIHTHQWFTLFFIHYVLHNKYTNFDSLLKLLEYLPQSTTVLEYNYSPFTMWRRSWMQVILNLFIQIAHYHLKSLMRSHKTSLRISKGNTTEQLPCSLRLSLVYERDNVGKGSCYCSFIMWKTSQYERW